MQIFLNLTKTALLWECLVECPIAHVVSDLARNQETILFLGPKKHPTHTPEGFPFTSCLFPEIISLH